MVVISGVEEGSAGQKAGIRKGDTLVSVNAQTITDVLDYRFCITEADLSLSLLRSGKPFTVRIRKAQYDDIGLLFDTYLMDAERACENACVFCFIDQNPRGMRPSIYFKDDDTRLSFLHGNYVTLTNLSDEELARMVRYRLSPVNVSVHTTDPSLRKKLLRNERAGEILRQLKILADGGIALNAQLVLCRGINDGPALQKSLSDLCEFVPELQSIAVVPAGLTMHRAGLFPLEDYDEKSASEVIEIVERFADTCLERFGTRLAFCADEFYVRAQKELPGAESYEDYYQLDNGVGLLRSLEEDVLEALESFAQSGKMPKNRSVTIATGKAAAPFLRALVERVTRDYPSVHCRVITVPNRFYGESVTVAGLLSGSDYLAALSGEDLGDALYLSSSSLRYEGDLFLDGMSLLELSETLSVPVIPVESNGDFVWKILTEDA